MSVALVYFHNTWRFTGHTVPYQHTLIKDAMLSWMWFCLTLHCFRWTCTVRVKEREHLRATSRASAGEGGSSVCTRAWCVFHTLSPVDVSCGTCEHRTCAESSHILIQHRKLSQKSMEDLRKVNWVRNVCKADRKNCTGLLVCLLIFIFWTFCLPVKEKKKKTARKHNRINKRKKEQGQ